MFWLVTAGMPWFFTFFLMTINPTHHIYNIQLIENVFRWNLFISKFSIAAPTIVITCCNTFLILCHWIFCTYRKKYYFIHIKHQIWIQMIKVTTMFKHLTMVFDNFCGNEFSRLTCLSVKKNADGKSSIFMWAIAVGPSELNKHSHQDAHAAILACDRSRA